MPHSNDGSERVSERPEEDVVEPRPGWVSNEFEFSNQPHQDLVEGLPATPQPQPSDQPYIPSAETEQDQPPQGPVPPSCEASHQHPIPPAEPELNATSRKTLFGLKRQVKETHFFNRFDYEQKYPRDPLGQERAENARVWLTYLDEAESYDRDKIDGWKDTVDVLLVFAGLFSAVVTTFLSQTSQNLQQNFAQVSASLLFEMVQLQRAQLTGGSIADIPNSPLTPNSSFTPSANASVVNGLWFASLTISLCTALFAVLTKQWLFYYQSPVSGTAREKVMVRQFRFEGLERWGVAVVVDLLPILLHLALGLFLIGLVVFILPLDIRIVWIIIILSGFTYILYLVSIILPIRYPQCPYVTPLTIYTDFFIQFFRLILSQLPSNHIGLMRLSIYRDRIFSEPSLRRFQYSLHLIGSTMLKTATRFWIFPKANITISGILQAPSSKNCREAQVRGPIVSTAAMLQEKALHWLFSTSSNPAVSRIVARSINVSPNYDAQRLFYYLLSRQVYNPQFEDKWDEDSLRLLLDNSEFFEDLYHLLRLAVLSGYSISFYKIVSFIREESSASLREDIKERYPELFSSILVLRRGPVEALLTGLRDNTLKLPQDVWLGLLQNARKDKELVSQIISSGTFNLFTWHESKQSSAKTCHAGAIHLANELPDPNILLPYHHSSISELDRSAYTYLFRYFVGERFPDGSSFESRYILFITIYQDLISNEPLIVHPMLRRRVLKHLLATFSHLVIDDHECIGGHVITATHLNRMQRDILMHNSFINDPMSAGLQEAAISCFECFWDYQMATTGDLSPFFTLQKEGLQFIYQYCSKGNSSELLVQWLFMPGNLSNLRMLLLEDYDHAKSNLKNCLKLLLSSSQSSVHHPKHKILYEEYIIPSIIHLFRATILSGISDLLFSVLCEPSVLAQAWELLATYPSFLYGPASTPSCPIIDRSIAVLALLPSRFDSASLKNIYDLMIGCCSELLHPYAMRSACISAYTFGRMAGLITDPNTFNFPSSVIDGPAFKRAFEGATDVRNELEHQYIAEKRRQAHPLLFRFSRITQKVRVSLWKERPEVEAAAPV